MKWVDRFFAWLLVVGAILHAFGSWRSYQQQPPLLVWAWSGSLAALLVAALNLLRANRPGDRGLAWVSFAGSLAWLTVALGFGAAIGKMLDPRVLIHAVNGAALAALSLRAIGLAGARQGDLASRPGT